MATMIFSCRMGRLTVYLSRSTSPSWLSVLTSSPAWTSVSVSPAVVTLPRSSTLPRPVVATMFGSHQSRPRIPELVAAPDLLRVLINTDM